jgi:hypothetical protein
VQVFMDDLRGDELIQNSRGHPIDQFAPARRDQTPPDCVFMPGMKEHFDSQPVRPEPDGGGRDEDQDRLADGDGGLIGGRRSPQPQNRIDAEPCARGDT